MERKIGGNRRCVNCVRGVWKESGKKKSRVWGDDGKALKQRKRGGGEGPNCNCQITQNNTGKTGMDKSLRNADKKNAPPPHELLRPVRKKKERRKKGAAQRHLGQEKASPEKAKKQQLQRGRRKREKGFLLKLIVTLPQEGNQAGGSAKSTEVLTREGFESP